MQPNYRKVMRVFSGTLYGKVLGTGAATTEKLDETSGAGVVDTDPPFLFLRTFPVSRCFSTPVSSIPFPNPRCFLSPLIKSSYEVLLLN